jgi:competence ComEA-like helix-hairpin-helix protein
MAAQLARRSADSPRVAASPDSRLALVCLVSAFGVVAVARFEAGRQPAFERSPSAVVGPTANRKAPSRGPAGAQLKALRDGRPLDVNRATAAELELLPGVGPSLARRLVDARARAGGFRDENDLLHVRGLGQKTLQKLKPFLLFSTKHVEHSADSELALGEGHTLSVHPEEADAHVDADGPAARGQIIDADP